MLKKVTSFRGVSNAFRTSWRKLAISSVSRDANKEGRVQDIVKGDGAEEKENLNQLLEDAATFKDANDKDWVTSPYPETAFIPQEEAKVTPKTAASDTTVILFPGQGQ